MTSKEIFEAIDLEKVGPELKTKLLTLEKATEGFTNDRVDARMDSVMNAFYNSIKDKKPEALKNIEVKEAVAEEVVVKTVNGKKKTTTRKVKRKVAGKRKKNTRKTPTPSKPLTKVTVSTIASEIRKPNETWSDALSRAKEIFRKRKDEQKAKSKKALDELRDFMKSDKYLKGWPRTYGKEKPDNDLERDLSRKALAPGRRISKTGRVYYENRDNRSDREANTFPRKIYLKEGGELMAPTRSLFELGGEVNVEPTILQNNPDYLVGTETMYEMFAKGGITARGLGKINDKVFDKHDFQSGSEIKSSRANKAKYAQAADDFLKQAGVEKGSLTKAMQLKLEDENLHTLNEFLVLNDYYQPGVSNKQFYLEAAEEQPDFYLGADGIIGVKSMAAKTMSKSSKLKYDPARDVEAIVIVDGPFNKMIMKGDFIGGAYQMEQGGLAKDYIYVSPRKIIFARLKSGEDIKPVNGFWVKKNATGTVYTGAKPKKGFSKISKFKVPRPINVTGDPSKNEKVMKLLGEFSATDTLRPAMTFVSIQDGQLVSTNAHYLIRLMDDSTKGVKKLVCESRTCKNLSDDERYPNTDAVIENVRVDFSESYNLVDLYEQLMAGREEVYAQMGRRSKNTFVVSNLKLKNNAITFDSGLLLQSVKGALELGWKTAFISYDESKSKAITITEEKVETGSKYRVLAGKDLILLMPILSGNFENQFDVEAEEAFELGGEVMVQPTILQNNPDYITSTATMGEWFEKGGSVGKSWKPINAVYYDSNDYNYPYTLIIGNLAWGISEEFDEPVFRGNVQKEFFMSTWDFAQKSGFMMADAQLPTNVLDKVKAIRSKDFDTLRGKRYPINPNDYPAFFEKGGSIGFEGLARKVAKRYEGKPVPSDYQSEYGKTYSKDEAMEVGRKVAAKVYRQQQAKMAKGGVVYLYYGGEQPDEMMKAANESEAANIAMKMGAEHYYFVAQMAKGGYVAVSENNGYWYIMSTPSSKEKAQQVIDMGVPRGEVGKVVTLEQAKAYNKVIGREYLEKGGGIYSSDKAWSVKVMLDDQPVDSFMVRGRNLKEARMMVEDYHEAKMEAKYGDDIYFEIKEAMAKGGQVDPLEKRVQKLQRELNSPRLRTFIEGDDSEEQKAREKEREEKLKEFYEVLAELRQKDAVMAKGGALYHRLMPGDEVLEIYKDYLIIENDWDFIYVIDFRPEVAKRIQVEEIEGENTIEAAKRVADRDFEYSKYAMGGSLEVHGLEEGDLIVEDEGAYINVLSEDGKIYYVDLGRGERSTEPPLPFEYGGKVKVFNIGTLAAKYGKKPQVVLEALREGADVEEEHTRDRVKAMQIAFDHLQEDFFYYPKLKAAEGGVDFEDFYEKGGQVPEQFLDSKGERKIDRKSIAELTDYVMALPQTKSIYFNEEAGEYVPSRRKLHADIINTFKKEVVCITEGQPIAIFMGGSPASGKSSFLRKYSPYLLKEEILKVDADEIRAMLPEYEGYNAAQTHLETKDIVNTLLSDRNIGIPCDFDLIYDGTMNSVKSYIPLMDILRKRGYKIFIVYMDNVPKDVIIKRALERYQKSGRFVPLEVIEDFFEKGKTAFNELKKDVDGYMVIDGSNQDYKIIEQGGMKLPQNREYGKLGEKINPKDIPALYKKGGKTKKA